MFWQPRERCWEGRGTLCLGALQEQSQLSAFQGGMGTLCLEVQRGHNPSGSPRARGYTPGHFDFPGTWVRDTGVFLPSAQACKEILMSTVQRLPAPALHPAAPPATWNAAQGQSAQLASTPCDVCDWERERGMPGALCLFKRFKSLQLTAFKESVGYRLCMVRPFRSQNMGTSKNVRTNVQC